MRGWACSSWRCWAHYAYADGGTIRLAERVADDGEERFVPIAEWVPEPGFGQGELAYGDPTFDGAGRLWFEEAPTDDLGDDARSLSVDPARPDDPPRPEEPGDGDLLFDREGRRATLAELPVSGAPDGTIAVVARTEAELVEARFEVVDDSGLPLHTYECRWPDGPDAVLCAPTGEAPLGALARLTVDGDTATAEEAVAPPGDQLVSAVVSPDRSEALLATSDSSLTRAINRWYRAPLGDPGAAPEPAFDALTTSGPAGSAPNAFAWL